MLNLNKRTKTKRKHKPTLAFNNCSHVWAYHCVQLSYETQHMLIIFAFILQTIITNERPYVTFQNKIRVLYVRYRKNNVRLLYVYVKMQLQSWKNFWYHPSLKQQ